MRAICGDCYGCIWCEGIIKCNNQPRSGWGIFVSLPACPGRVDKCIPAHLHSPTTAAACPHILLRGGLQCMWTRCRYRHNRRRYIFSNIQFILGYLYYIKYYTSHTIKYVYYMFFHTYSFTWHVFKYILRNYLAHRKI